MEAGKGISSAHYRDERVCLDGKNYPLGYPDERDLKKAGDEILYILKFLPNLQPFQLLDIQDEQTHIRELFTEENAYSLMNHFRIRGDIAKMDAAQVIYNIMPQSYDQETYTIVSIGKP